MGENGLGEAVNVGAKGLKKRIQWVHRSEQYGGEWSRGANSMGRIVQNSMGANGPEKRPVCGEPSRGANSVWENRLGERTVSGRTV